MPHLPHDTCPPLPYRLGCAIATEARRWCGSPFRHQGRQPAPGATGTGLDCLGLIIAVARSLALRDTSGGALAQHDRLDYPTYPDAARLEAGLSQALKRLDATAATLPGDIALFALERQPQHLGILSPYPGAEDSAVWGLIHAYSPAGQVVEHRLDGSWQRRMVARLRVDAARQNPRTLFDF